jgi:hypothetical protein
MKRHIALVTGFVCLFAPMAMAFTALQPDLPVDRRMRDGTPYYSILARCSGIHMAYALSKTGQDQQIAMEVQKQFNHSAFNRVMKDRTLDANDAQTYEAVGAMLAPISEKGRTDWAPIFNTNGGEEAYNAQTQICIHAAHESDFEMN